MPPTIQPDDTDWSSFVRERGSPVWWLGRHGDAPSRTAGHLEAEALVPVR